MMKRTGWTALAGIALIAGVTACSSADDTGDAAATTDAADAQTPAAATTTDASTTPAATGTLPAGVTAEMVAAGEQQFKSGVCIACHGPDATGTPNAPNLTDSEWLNADGTYESIAKVIKEGVAQPKVHTAAAMPPMGGMMLSDQQVNEIAAYVYSLSHR